MTGQAELTEDQWVEEYKPQVNAIHPGQGFGYGDGTEDPAEDNSCLYGTTPEEIAALDAAGENRVWTVLDGDDDAIVIASGRHHVNRIGYIITQEPWAQDCEIVLDD